MNHRENSGVRDGADRGEVVLRLNGDVILDMILSSSSAVERIRAVLLTTTTQTRSTSPFFTIPEAADYLRAKRQRVDDLLSAGLLTRIKDGGRTLLLRAEVEQYVLSTARRGDTPVTPAVESLSGNRIPG